MRPTGRVQAMGRAFLLLVVCCFGFTNAQADHLPVGDQLATPYNVPDNINQIEANDVIFFEDTNTAILEVVGMNCGTMTYDFFDAGGQGAPFSDEGADQAFTICLRNPMIQTFSVDFGNVTFDPTSGESLLVFDGDDTDDSPIAGSGMDAGGIANILAGALGQQQQRGGMATSLIKGILDRDGDGSAVDDVAQIGMSIFSKFFRK